MKILTLILLSLILTLIGCKKEDLEPLKPPVEIHNYDTIVKYWCSDDNLREYSDITLDREPYHPNFLFENSLDLNMKYIGSPYLGYITPVSYPNPKLYLQINRHSGIIDTVVAPINKDSSVVWASNSKSYGYRYNIGSLSIHY